MRRRYNRWSLRVTDWIPREGKKARERQKVRLADEMKSAGIMWPQPAQHWVNWRNMGDIFALQWA